ncbi:3972_t:CDS:2 [Racocetra fulgida]|uniref:3972_t:CDS:1 n=1 Tax=Racocetra fulgida TaxID=60492 RepID=A0A9N9AKA9_9GLOM|nr:3972_t:CDS:2 [Racocetra fulgida]
MDADILRQIELQIEILVAHLQNPLTFSRIIQLDINAYVRSRRTLRQKINIKQTTGYNLFKKQATEEAHLINITDGRVIGMSTNIVWRNKFDLLSEINTPFHWQNR